MTDHEVVSRAEWMDARKRLLAKEKEFTRLRDRLSAERRELPWLRIDKDYAFEGPNGRETLAQLFGEQVREVLDLVRSLPRRRLEEDDQVVDRPELVERLAEGVDLAVPARDEAQHVRLEPDARADTRAEDEDEEGGGFMASLFAMMDTPHGFRVVCECP